MIRLGPVTIEFSPASGEDADAWIVRWAPGKRKGRLLGYAVNLQGACQIAVGHLTTQPERGRARKAVRSLEEAVQELHSQLAILLGETGPGDPAKASRQS